MNHSSGLLNRPYMLSHDDASAYSCYSPHDRGLNPSPPPLNPLVNQNFKESSASTFFPTHRAHRYLPGPVEKPQQNSPDALIDTSLHSTHWMQWSNQSEDLLMANNSYNGHVFLNHQQSTNLDPNVKTKDIPTPTGAYRTRSLVHHLVNLPNSSEPKPSVGPSNSSTWDPPHDQHLSPQINSYPPPSQFNSSSTIMTSSHHVQSSSHAEMLTSFPDESTHFSSDFVSHRNKDGLPSNSHHLLNSPEIKNIQIKQFLHEDTPYFTEPRHDQLTIDQVPLPHSEQVTQTTTTSLNKPTRPITRLSSTTPQKFKVNQNPQAPTYTTDTLAPPPTEDAASILMELSRHEPPKHGMSLRRGRGSASSRPDPPRTGSPDERPPIPLTPSGHRYRTRSQIHEENLLKQHNHRDEEVSLPICDEKPDSPLDEQAFHVDKGNPNPVPLELGYGPPPGYNQGLISVSGSTTASTCNSRSNVEGSSLNFTPGYESNLTLNNFKPYGNFPGRLHMKLSGGSTALSISHSSTPAAFMDEDAKSTISLSTQATSLISPPGLFTRRTFPSEVPIDSNFPRLYRSFFVPSAFGDREPIKFQAEAYKIHIMKAPPNSNYNTPAHGYLDLYTPRYVKGVGAEKLGLCCICAEPKERGGEDTALWLKMKVSSYSYHLSFFHGINNADGLPFSPPVEIRHIKRCHVAANEKLELKEGRCHHCNKWVPMEGVKMQEVKVPELFWWKHAKSCHKSRLAGECHVHIPDEIYDLVSRQQPATGSLYDGSGGGSLPASSCSTPYSHYNMSEMSTSNSPYTSRYPASPAPTCSSFSQSGGSRVHPSVAAQRASAGRVYKRKASNGGLGTKRRDSSLTADQSHSPQSSIWHPLPLSMGMNSSTGGSSTSIQSHQHLIQNPQSPTPVQPNYSATTGRKTRRSNMSD